jgi:peptidyl-dipeptidase A
VVAGCKPADHDQVPESSAPHSTVVIADSGESAGEGPTIEDAKAFVAEAELELERLSQNAGRMQWVLENFITADTELLAAQANESRIAAEVRIAAGATRFIGLEGLDFDTGRKLKKLRHSIVVPAPTDSRKTAEQAEIGATLGSIYGRGTYCRENGQCLDLDELEELMAYSRSEDELLEAWDGWRQVSQPMKPLYERQVELANEGARELGYENTGVMWRSVYDMEAADFPEELDRLWNQARPLYEALHCHARARLGERYGTDLVPPDGLIPAHLLGNMWAQTWGYIYDIVGPDQAGADSDLTAKLLSKNFDAQKMVRTGEAFFSSLGFDELPESFWENSLLVKPRDRDVVCHASAWTVDEKEDIRIKMCIDIDEEDFTTIHHELGHNYYQRAYSGKSYLYRDGAHDGFHEAVGDAITLSITPEYLVSIGLLDKEPDGSGDIGLLMKQALETVVFMPFGLLVDKWRWKVFSGEVSADGYNRLWWELRASYQGISAPNERPAEAFDPGAKYHVSANTPYSRYFMAEVLKFQFHRALCEIAGDQGPIHRCSIHGSTQAGQKLNAMLEMGASRPWPEALETLSGNREMDATAMLDYFAPLQKWLDEQNEGRQCGWRN